MIRHISLSAAACVAAAVVLTLAHGGWVLPGLLGVLAAGGNVATAILVGPRARPPARHRPPACRQAPARALAPRYDVGRAAVIAP
jgi:hypothetical protein